MSTQKGVKRKRTAVTLETKLEILKKIKLGRSNVSLAEEYGLGKTTVSDIKRDQNKLTHLLETGVADKNFLLKKSQKSAQNVDLDKAVYTWFTQERTRGTPLSGPIVMAKALSFASQLNGEGNSFKASQGWLNKFKIRYGIRQLDVAGEKLSADTTEIESFRSALKAKVEELGLTQDQIYNADESGLLWRGLPDKTLAHKDEKSAPGHKKAKERITVLFTVNATGTHKLPPLIIGKSQKPRCFNHLNMSNLPAHYTSQNKCWMTAEIFKDWFFSDFVPQVRRHLRKKNLESKALLLIDNCPAHPSIDQLSTSDGNITTVFLPKNTTSILQPLDGGLIGMFKKKYRSQMLNHIVSTEGELSEIVKKVTLKDALYMTVSSWNEISEETVKKVWKKTLFPENTEEAYDDTEDDVPLTELQTLLKQKKVEMNQEEVAEWLTSDEKLQTFIPLTDEEIVQSVSQPVNQAISDESESDNESPAVKPLTHGEGAYHLRKFLDYYETQWDSDPMHMAVFQLVHKQTVKKSIRSRTQKDIRNFFGK